MESIRINEADIADLKIASLPSRPTAPKAFGGYGYTATEMKAAFDKLPLYIIKKFNSLLDCILSSSDDSLSRYMPTGISSTHKLSDMFADILSGVFATYLSVSGVSLSECISGIKAQSVQCLTMVGTQTSRIDTHETKIATHTSEIAAAVERVRATERRIAINEAAISSLKQKVGSLEGAGSVDIESVIIDCGSPADLGTSEGGNE